tara:strand:- start:314 stop:1468 length:1155 start_codon:yes stop_codon:yes gene_type:complete
MNKGSFFKALGVLAQSPGMQRYLNVLKPVTEGIQTKGMDFFNLAVKKVVDEGDQIETSLTTKKYVHPDRPDIFVEIDTSTGNANVGLVDPEAGAFAYTDEMKKENLISSLEDEGLGFGGSRVEAERLLKLRKEKAEAMKEIAKGKGKNKRARMIEAYNKIIKDKKADGGRVGLFKGGSLKAILQAARMNKIFGIGGPPYKPEQSTLDVEKLTEKEFGVPLSMKNLKQMLSDTSQIRKNLSPREYAETKEALPKFMTGFKQYKGNVIKNKLLDDKMNAEIRIQVAREQLKNPPKGVDLEINRKVNQQMLDEATENLKNIEKALADIDVYIAMQERSGVSSNANGGLVGLKDGGEVSLTVVEIPDISGPGVEALFKNRDRITNGRD